MLATSSSSRILPSICRQLCASTRTLAGAEQRELRYERHGDPREVVTLVKSSAPNPALKPNEVAIEFLAAPINPADINQIQGVYAVKPPLPAVGGNEGVARIQQTGSSNVGLKVGQWVIPSRSGVGTWRDRAVLSASDLIALPDGLAVEAAATFQVNPPTAYRMLADFATLQKGDVVIQNGANSAVGRYVIQICRLRGYRSVNIVRDRPDIDSLKSELTALGADVVVTEEEFAKSRATYAGTKLALNCVGGRGTLQLSAVLGRRGHLVTYGGMSKQPLSIPTGPLIFNDIRICGFWVSHWYTYEEHREERRRMYDEIGDWYKSGQLVQPPFETHPAERYSDCLKTILDGTAKKKQILLFSPQH